jgi:hypothetical protein
MQYKVIPFQAQIGETGGTSNVASQLESLIANETLEGWEYVRLETVETFIQGSSGCFGLGATQSRVTGYSVAVFRKSDPLPPPRIE